MHFDTEIELWNDKYYKSTITLLPITTVIYYILLLPPAQYTVYLCTLNHRTRSLSYECTYIVYRG